MNAVKPFLLPSLCLTAADQLTKLIISFFFMDSETGLIGSLLRFCPVQNTLLSYGGNFSALLADKAFLLLLNLAALFLLFSGYLLYRAKHSQTRFTVKSIMVCGISGCVCSLMDKLLWGGSLDFLQIPNWFTFDLKDCYLTAAEVLFLVLGLRHSKEISVKEYLSFCLHKFRL